MNNIKVKLKDVFFHIPIPNGFKIGLTDNFAVEITTQKPEDLKKLHYLLKLLNSSNTVENIIKKFIRKFPDSNADDILKTIKIFLKKGIIEIIPNEISDFSPLEIERFKNQLAFFSLFENNTTSRYEMQKKIKNSTVALIGLGGAGSNLAILLSAIGIGKIIGIDFDKVTLNNLNRQLFYNPSDIGKMKTKAIAEKIKKFNPSVIFEPRNIKINSIDSAIHAIDNADFVFCTADSPIYDLYNFVNIATAQKNIPWISFGTIEATAIIGPLIIPGETACYNCYILNELKKDKHFLNDVLYIKKFKKDTVNASIAPAFYIGAGILALQFLKYVTGFAKTDLENKILFLNLKNFKIQYKRFKKSIKCQICGKNGT